MGEQSSDWLQRGLSRSSTLRLDRLLVRTWVDPGAARAVGGHVRVYERGSQRNHAFLRPSGPSPSPLSAAAAHSIRGDDDHRRRHRSRESRGRAELAQVPIPRRALDLRNLPPRALDVSEWPQFPTWCNYVST